MQNDLQIQNLFILSNIPDASPMHQGTKLTESRLFRAWISKFHFYRCMSNAPGM